MKFLILMKLFALVFLSISIICCSGNNNTYAQAKYQPKELNIEDESIFTDLPLLNVYISDTTDSGYLFLAMHNYLMILDNDLTPVFLKTCNESVNDFKIQKNGLLSYHSEAEGKFYMLDSCFNVIDSSKVENDYYSNFHDIKITEDGHVFILALDYQIVGMDTVVAGGQPNATVIGSIIQEFDEAKNLVFQWKSWDHYKITDTYDNLTLNFIDYVHGNAIDIDYDGNILFSARNMSEITKIDRVSGDILWRLGGKNNEFEFINDSRSFSAQHAVLRNSNGNITLFDNGNYNGAEYSRGVEYEIDELNYTAKLVYEYRHNPDLYTPIMGNMQSLPNGNKIIGWGANQSCILTEYKPDGTPVYEIGSPEKAFVYRVFRFPWKTSLFEANMDTIKFDTVNFGESKTAVINIKNNSDKTIELSGYTVSKSDFIVTESFPINMDPYGNIELTIKFEPTVLGGEHNDVLTLNSDGLSELDLPQRIAIQVYLQGYSPDVNPPEFTFAPENNSNNVSIDTKILVKSNEPLRLLDNSDLTEADLYSIFKLKKGGIEGIDVPFNATVNENFNEISIYPENLEYNTDYCLLIEDLLEDLWDNRISPITSCLSTTNATHVLLPDVTLMCTIYPNPTNDVARMNFHKKPQMVKISDVSGKLVYMDSNIQEMNDYEIDFGDKKGMYFVFVVYEDGSVSSLKLLKN